MSDEADWLYAQECNTGKAPIPAAASINCGNNNNDNSPAKPYLQYKKRFSEMLRKNVMANTGSCDCGECEFDIPRPRARRASKDSVTMAPQAIEAIGQVTSKLCIFHDQFQNFI